MYSGGPGPGGYDSHQGGKYENSSQRNEFYGGSGRGDAPLSHHREDRLIDQDRMRYNAPQEGFHRDYPRDNITSERSSYTHREMDIGDWYGYDRDGVSRNTHQEGRAHTTSPIYPPTYNGSHHRSPGNPPYVKCHGSRSPAPPNLPEPANRHRDRSDYSLDDFEYRRSGGIPAYRDPASPGPAQFRGDADCDYHHSPRYRPPTFDSDYNSHRESNRHGSYNYNGHRDEYDYNEYDSHRDGYNANRMQFADEGGKGKGGGKKGGSDSYSAFSPPPGLSASFMNSEGDKGKGKGGDPTIDMGKGKGTGGFKGGGPNQMKGRGKGGKSNSEIAAASGFSNAGFGNQKGMGKAGGKAGGRVTLNASSNRKGGKGNNGGFTGTSPGGARSGSGEDARSARKNNAKNNKKLRAQAEQPVIELPSLEEQAAKLKGCRKH